MSESTHTPTEDSSRLLSLISAVVVELHPSSAHRHSINLDNRLDKDLGLDSLARVELLARIEKSFDVALPDTIFAEAETPRDLLRVIAASDKAQALKPGQSHSSVEQTGAMTTPDQAMTLIDVLNWHAQNHPDHPHIRLYDDNNDGEVLSYRELAEEAQAVAAGLLKRDVQPGQTIAIMLPTGREYFTSFYGVLIAGAIPVPVYPPARISQLEEHLKRHIAILQNCQAAALITTPEATPVARLLRSQVDSLQHVITAEELARTSGLQITPTINAHDIAFLQYTSGSTGSPKGVVLTHANLLANIRAYGTAMEIQSNDVCISWLPLYHDMGLIGSWFGSLYFGIPLVIMSPLAFLARPQRWLWAIHRYRGTLSAGPNFAYEMCVRRIQDQAIEGLDLSSWRGAMNGAEAISPKTLHGFCERFTAYGFKREAMKPVYGLAESSVGLAFPPMHRGPVIDRIQREPFMKSGRAIPAIQTDTNVREFVACGHPLPGHQIRIVESTGRIGGGTSGGAGGGSETTGGSNSIELADRQEGRLQFQGPSTTSGYYRNPEKTRALFDGDWLESGDRAYIADGDVFITGRTKDIIIKGGRNIYPEEIEEAIGSLPGISKGGVAVFGTVDSKTGTEQLIVVAETRRQDEETQQSLQREINAIATDLIGMPPDDIVLAPPRSVPKTSSGKIRRASSRELYERNAIGKPHGNPAWQQIRFALSGIMPAARQGLRFLTARLYALYFWLVLGLTAVLTWSAVVIIPIAAWRWPLMRVSIRLMRRTLGIGYIIQGLENLPSIDQPCVFIANHSSYLDSLILVETLNRPISFVAKAELQHQLFPRLFLKRIQAVYVDRFDQEQGIEDAKQIVHQARAGRSFLFYPEGTCQRMPGLLPFHMGAFTAAADAGLPVVPITIRGSRTILRPDTWFPHRGSIAVSIGKPMAPSGPQTDTWSESIRLRNAAREEILRRCGEPDLSHERIIV